MVRPACLAKRRRCWRGAAALDYVLLMGVVLPLATLVFWAGPRIMQLVYEMLCLFVGSPWM